MARSFLNGINLNTQQITGLAAGTAASDAVNKSQLDTRQHKVSVTVGRSGSSADYICDGTADDVEIQAAINAVSTAGGGDVFIKEGTYSVNTIINLASNVNVRGSGGNTKLVITSTPNAILKAQDKSNIIVSGLVLNNAAKTVANSHCVYLQNVTDVTVEDCRMLDLNGFGIFLTAASTATSQRVWIRDNYLYGRGQNDVIGGGPANSTGAIVRDVFVENNIVIQDSTANTTGHKDAINFVAVYRIRFVGNIVEGSVLFGSEQFPHRHSMIQNNTIKKAIGATRAAVGLVLDPTHTQTGEGVIISNNTIEGGFIDVYSNPTTPLFQNLVINGNVIDASGTSTSLGEAAIVVVKANGAVITGNSVFKSASDGIWLRRGTNAQITGNIIRDSAGFGYREDDSADHNHVIGNTFLANTSGAISGVGTNNVIHSNKGTTTVQNAPAVQKSGDTMTGVLTLSGAPTSDLHAATKGYVDATRQGLDFKDSVRVATTASIANLSNTSVTIDGVTCAAGDRVLVKNGASPDGTAAVSDAHNGIYVVGTVTTGNAPLTRSTDADANAEVTAGMYTFVSEGTANADSGWVLTTNDAVTLGTTLLTFTQFSGAGQITAGAGLTKTGNTLDVGAGSGITVSADSISANDATTTAKGIVQLAGDLGGTATAPTVPALANKVDKNAAITAGTATKVTYDAKGLVTAGAAATTSDIAEGTNLYYSDARADARIGAASVNALSDVVITTPTSGQVIKFNGTSWVNDADATGTGGGYATIQDEGTALTQRGTVNFIGSTVTATDDSTNLKTNITINAEAPITAGTTAQYYRGDKTFAALDKTAVGLANVDNTSDATKNSATATLINKTLTSATNIFATASSIADSGTPTPNGASRENELYITALAQNATFGAPAGTPTNGNKLIIRIKDNGGARTLAWNAIYRAIGVTLPTSTTATKTMYVAARYNSTDATWDVLAVGNQA